MCQSLTCWRVTEKYHSLKVLKDCQHLLRQMVYIPKQNFVVWNENSLMTFQRLVNDPTSNLDNCEVYIDDLIVFSNSWDQHVQHIKALFDKLTEVNFTRNLIKSKIAYNRVIFFGHVVCQGEVKPSKAKVEGIETSPVPTDKKQFMRFLSMAGDYRRFCPQTPVLTF